MFLQFYTIVFIQLLRPCNIRKPEVGNQKSEAKTGRGKMAKSVCASDEAEQKGSAGQLGD